LDKERNTVERKDSNKLVSLGVAAEMTGYEVQTLRKYYVNDDQNNFDPDKLNVQPRLKSTAHRRVTLNEIHRFINRNNDKG